MVEDEGYVEQGGEAADDAVMGWFGGLGALHHFRLLAGVGNWRLGRFLVLRLRQTD